VGYITRIIGVVSGKGGVGKTTIVANLGSVLSSKFKKDVIIVDCNLTTSHLGLYLGMYYCPITLNKVLTGEAEIGSAMYDHFTGMRVIPASLSLDDLKGVDMFNLKDTIRGLFGKSDIVILDSAPGLGREAISVLRSSDEVLFVTTPFVPSTMDIIRCNEVISEIGARPLGIVLNMMTKEKYELTAKEVEGLSELPVIASIPVDKNVPRSLSLKTPVTIYQPNSPASKQIISLAAKLIGVDYKPPGFFSRVFKFWKSQETYA